MIINSNDLKNYEMLGVGSEGIVYKYNDLALKIIPNANHNKIEKIKILQNMDIKNFITPKDIVYDENNQFLGYTMELIDHNKNSIRKEVENSNSLSEKIKILKLLENAIKLAHKNNIIIVDFNYSNFVVNGNDIIMLDTDNFYVKDYPNDINPSNFYDYYCDKVSYNITKDIDIMSYTLNLLWLLVDEKFSRDKLKYFNDDEYIEDYIKKLLVPNNVKSLLLEIVSDSINKPYINNEFDCLMTSDQYIKKAR